MEPFKNKLSPELVQCLAEHLSAQLKAFDAQAFVDRILAELPQLELKQRSQLIADQLHQVLPADFDQRDKVLRAILQPKGPVEGERQSDASGMAGWGMMPLCQLVGQQGQEHFEQAMNLLCEMTPRFTAEFDVRPFIVADQDRALAMLKAWVRHPDEHVRRLVSEGSRPRLPWGIRLNALVADPSPTIPLLTELRDDPSEYVRRSVANHLNDIAKDHPDLVASIAADWLQDASTERTRLVRHACRTLIKQGHVPTLRAFGLQAPSVELDSLRILTDTVALGNALEFETSLRSTGTVDQQLVIDYVLHLKKANGKQAPKVFKWKTVNLAAGETLETQKSHSLKPITTRRYYSGEQRLSLRINGEDFGMELFELAVPESDKIRYPKMHHP